MARPLERLASASEPNSAWVVFSIAAASECAVAAARACPRYDSWRRSMCMSLRRRADVADVKEPMSCSLWHCNPPTG